MLRRLAGLLGAVGEWVLLGGGAGDRVLPMLQGAGLQLDDACLAWLTTEGVDARGDDLAQTYAFVHGLNQRQTHHPMQAGALRAAREAVVAR